MTFFKLKLRKRGNDNKLRREREQARKELGLCPRCGEKSVEGKLLCLYHELKNSESCQKYYLNNFNGRKRKPNGSPKIRTTQRNNW